MGQPVAESTKNPRLAASREFLERRQVAMPQDNGIVSGFKPGPAEFFHLARKGCALFRDFLACIGTGGRQYPSQFRRDKLLKPVKGLAPQHFTEKKIPSVFRVDEVAMRQKEEATVEPEIGPFRENLYPRPGKIVVQEEIMIPLKQVDPDTCRRESLQFVYDRLEIRVNMARVTEPEIKKIA